MKFVKVFVLEYWQTCQKELKANWISDLWRSQRGSWINVRYMGQLPHLNMLNWESSTERLEQANWTNKDLSQLLMMLAPLHSWKESWFVPQGEPCLKSFDATQVFMVLWTSLVIIWSYLWNNSVQCLTNVSYLWMTNKSALKPLFLTILTGMSFSFRSGWPIRVSGSQLVALIKFRWPRLISECHHSITFCHLNRHWELFSVKYFSSLFLCWCK